MLWAFHGIFSQRNIYTLRVTKHIPVYKNGSKDENLWESEATVTPKK